jgi:hypothetical protein
MTFYVASQLEFIFVSVFFITQFGNFLIHPRIWVIWYVANCFSTKFINIKCLCTVPKPEIS